MGKLRAALLFGAGYLAGTKAGRERYEAIARQARTIAQHPRTQQLVQQAKDTAATRLPAGVTERVQGWSSPGRHAGGTDATPTIDLTTPATGRSTTASVVEEPAVGTPVPPPSHL